jgi:hypothetical protein
MANAENAKIKYEAGQNQSPMAALSDSGDATIFASGADLWSRRTGFEPDIRPDGLLTGGAIKPSVSGGDNSIDVAALTAYIGGVSVVASAAINIVCARATSANTHIIYSITADGTGTIVAASGSGGTSFSEARGAAGGPPLIAGNKTEIGQVRLSGTAAVAVLAADIKQVPNTHQERSDFPIISKVDYRNGNVVFNSALPLIHTGNVPKKVFASYAEPEFADVPKGVDYVPAETSHSTSSTPLYDGLVLGSKSSTLNQGSFTAYLEDGISDPLVRLKNEFLWFKFFPSKFKAPYRLDQGTLGISRTFPAGDEIQASCTISPESDGSDVIA